MPQVCSCVVLLFENLASGTITLEHFIERAETFSEEETREFQNVIRNLAE